jgi:putative transposase
MGKTKTALAKALQIARSTLYYVSKKESIDWLLKAQIENVLRQRGQRSYGSRRIAWLLGINRKRIQRVMRKYGIKPYRRHRKKWRKSKHIVITYPNLLLTVLPAYPGHIWAADFTELSWHGVTIYVATVIDLYTRKIVGVAISLRKGAQLTLQALWNALLYHPRPEIFHSDNGTEYNARVFIATLNDIGSLISRSHPGCPWENGYQESWYDKFKLELGDPNQFRSFGELVAEIYRTVWDYNHTRIHSALKMPPAVFTEMYERANMKNSIQLSV